MLARYVYSGFGAEAYHRSARPARTAWRGRSCCWDKVNIAKFDGGVSGRLEIVPLTLQVTSSQHVLSLIGEMTKLRAFVEAGRSHVDARDQRRGGSRRVRTSVAIFVGVFGGVVVEGGGRVGGGIGGGGGVGGGCYEGGQVRGWRIGGNVIDGGAACLAGWCRDLWRRPLAFALPASASALSLSCSAPRCFNPRASTPFSSVRFCASRDVPL